MASSTWTPRSQHAMTPHNNPLLHKHRSVERLHMSKGCVKPQIFHVNFVLSWRREKKTYTGTINPNWLQVYVAVADFWCSVCFYSSKFHISDSATSGIKRTIRIVYKSKRESFIKRWVCRRLNWIAFWLSMSDFDKDPNFFHTDHTFHSANQWEATCCSLKNNKEIP